MTNTVYVCLIEGDPVPMVFASWEHVLETIRTTWSQSPTKPVGMKDGLGKYEVWHDGKPQVVIFCQEVRETSDHF